MTMNDCIADHSALIRNVARGLRAALLAGLFLSGVTGCAAGGGGTEEPGLSIAAGPTAASVSLAWDPVQDSTVYAYYVHYGKQSPGQPGSCAYEESEYVTSPSAVIAGLDPNTQYYFSVSAYNGLDSACSEEVATITAASQI